MNTDWNPWRSLIVLQVAVLLVGCGVIASIWRGVEFVIARDQRSQVEQERFHAESISALQKLAANAGVLTTADLCPVRFRLRIGDGHNIPSFADGGTKFQLSARTETGLTEVACVNMDSAGTVDFGLNPPGDYRLQLEMPDEMTLTHDFEVLPGVPIDRLVYCPQPAYVDDRRVQIQIAWPPEFQHIPPLAVCLVEPARYVVREWEWQPPPHWEPVLVPASPYDPDQWASLAEDEGALPGGLTVLEPPQIPYVYCQIREISFFVASSPGPDAVPRMTPLTTVCFGVSDGDHSSSVSVGSIWHTQVPPPRFSNLHSSNQIELPHEVTEFLQNLLCELQ
jgi:hypothetical protein